MSNRRLEARNRGGWRVTISSAFAASIVRVVPHN